jgi:catechol 2,3-dioxygenase-like lactoylglutathione lyase family enzyme
MYTSSENNRHEAFKNMNLIDGIGGVFLFSNNPKRLAEWYRENLGITYEESPDCSSIYKSFVYRDLQDASVKRTTTWAILPSDDDISHKPRTGQINYRVRSMAETLSHVRSRGVAIDKTEDCEYGKFAWVTDPDGNKIELFEEPSEPV